MSKNAIDYENKRWFLAEHLVDCGWIANQALIDAISTRRDEESITFEKVIWGKMGKSFYLISPDEKYRLDIDARSINVRKNDRDGSKILTVPISTLQLTTLGIRDGIIDISIEVGGKLLGTIEQVYGERIKAGIAVMKDFK